MNWYYAEAGQQKGPISDWDFANAARTGAIRPETLVWHEGLPEWTPLSRVRPDLAMPANIGAIGGINVPEQQKALLIQQMREGVLPANMYQTLQRTGPVYVGFWWRVLAYLIDAIISCMVAFPIAMLFPPPHHHNLFAPPEPGTPMIDINWVAQVLTLALSCAYYTIMTGAWGGTVGKLALGFRVVRADGAKVSYPRALGRWAASHLLNTIILYLFTFGLPLIVLLVGGGFAAQDSSFDLSRMNEFFAHISPGVVLLAFVAMVFGFAAGTFPWWMVGMDQEKRALHDRICSTRVVRAPMQ